MVKIADFIRKTRFRGAVALTCDCPGYAAASIRTLSPQPKITGFELLPSACRLALLIFKIFFIIKSAEKTK